MDNAGCHLPDLKEKYMKSVYLPPNTTLMLQPLDLGIIKTFKVYYCKLLMRFILAKIETCSSASKVLQSVNVLHAIRWVAEAWKIVSETTIKKCFRKAGILRHDFSVVSPLIPAASDPFSDIDSCDLDESGDGGCEELTELIHRIQGPKNACSVSELLASESEIPVYSEFAASTWDEDFMAEIGPQSKGFCEHDNEEEDGPEDVGAPSTTTEEFERSYGML